MSLKAGDVVAVERQDKPGCAALVLGVHDQGENHEPALRLITTFNPGAKESGYDVLEWVAFVDDLPESTAPRWHYASPDMLAQHETKPDGPAVVTTPVVTPPSV